MRQIDQADIPLPRLQAWMEAREASISFTVRRYAPLALRLLKWLCVPLAIGLAGAEIFYTARMVIYDMEPPSLVAFGWVVAGIIAFGSCYDMQPASEVPLLGRSRFAEVPGVQRSGIWQP